MFISMFKYDVAVSVAEEDKAVAELIVAGLKQRNVRYYFYLENQVEGWGQPIMDITSDSYGKNSRFILAITSRFYPQGYWAGIERLIALRHRRFNVLQLRLDDTPIDGLSKHVVYLEWRNNPAEIAEILWRKVRQQRRQQARVHVWPRALMALLLIILLLVYFFNWTVMRPVSERPGPKTDKILIAGNGRDSFYISNTEVTVAQYRAFCDRQGIAFPLQLPAAHENGPIVNVTWEEALAYCKSLQGRLPTESEWEDAARGGLFTKYSGSGTANEVAVYNRAKPAAVASKAPNGYGLYDMTGNVAEWCADWSDSSQKWKSVRGGTYNSKINPVNELAVGYRAKEAPSTRSPYIGFRIVWDKK
ncbi:TIR domain-containing protein [Chitinophaga lutea]|uniref:TIR domain-containing protein n=1 Tax=Chitinophaga lutea TaxID=2488634 RepID=A0A3N4PM06_9BACT|nr:SUMF1/EgtB/PvdO family nonheme iron enzyme [Chitinophaga lutea]RPE09733.1 TIR domain-containing protein [Chitinophaga lutea]